MSERRFGQIVATLCFVIGVGVLLVLPTRPHVDLLSVGLAAVAGAVIMLGALTVAATIQRKAH